MPRAHITSRVEAETKEFFSGEYARRKKVKGIGRALDEAAKELKAQPSQVPAKKK